MRVKYYEWNENSEKVIKYFRINDKNVYPLYLVSNEIMLREEYENKDRDGWCSECHFPTIIKPIGFLNDEVWMQGWNKYDKADRNVIRLKSLHELIELGLIYIDENTWFLDQGIVGGDYFMRIEIFSPFYDVCDALKDQVNEKESNYMLFDQNSGRVEYRSNFITLSKTEMGFILLELITSPLSPVNGWTVDEIIRHSKGKFTKRKQITDCVIHLKRRLGVNGESFPIYMKENKVIYQP